MRGTTLKVCTAQASKEARAARSGAGQLYKNRIFCNSAAGRVPPISVALALSAGAPFTLRRRIAENCRFCKPVARRPAPSGACGGAAGGVAANCHAFSSPLRARALPCLPYGGAVGVTTHPVARARPRVRGGLAAGATARRAFRLSELFRGFWACCFGRSALFLSAP